MSFCDQAALQRLEYPRLRTLLAGQTQSEPGRLLAEQLTPLTEENDVVTALGEVDEAVVLLAEEQSPGLGGCPDIRSIVAQSQAEGSLIDVDGLLKISASLRVMQQCRLWSRSLHGDLLITGIVSGILPLDELQGRLKDAIGPRGELLDSASFVLGDLRYQIRHTRSHIKQQLDQLLNSDQYAACFQERLITQRNGRYVVPLKSDCRGQVKGFIQDESASGQTLYLEPARVLNENNRLQQLLREEQREERRILLQLADLVRASRAVLLENQQLLARLDLRFAAARLSQAYQGCRPQLVRESVVELKQVRHPLLVAHEGSFNPDKAVAIDLLLPENCRALVISGPNTGGKSVALKTLGLLQLMLRSGLHVPCHADSRVHLYRRMHVDIGDEQSIAESLSTFSGHLLRLREILAQADADTLVLLDEAGSGTDPAEGAALIQAVLDELCHLGAKTLATTHLGQLKHFAHSHPQIANAAVEFDPGTLLPTYRLRYGVPGASSALRTASRLGLPSSVVERAAEYLGQEELDHSALLAQLNSQQQELDQQLQLARQARLKAEAAQQLRHTQLQQLKEKKKDILQRAGRRAEELISSTEAQMKKIRKAGSQRPSPQQAVEEKARLQTAREQITPFKPKPRRGKTAPVALQPDELVRITALGIEGRVTRVSADMLELLVNGKRMRQPLGAVEQYNPRRFAAAQKPTSRVVRETEGRQVSPQLKLVGQRVEDALALLGPFIDQALLHDLTRIEIIHGAGEGVLRRAIREFLAEQKGISAFYAAPLDQGGDNTTIAELNG